MHLHISLLFFCCAPLADLNEVILDHYNLVFVGEVIEVHHPTNHWFWKHFRDDGFKYSFKVIEGFRGVKSGQVIQLPSDIYTSLGVHTSVGRRWLIILNNSTDRPANLHACSYSIRLNSESAQSRLQFIKDTLND